MVYSELIDKATLYNIKAQVDRVKQDFASAIIFDGGLGKGKTTSAFIVANAIHELTGFPQPLDLKLQFARGGDEFIKKFNKCVDAKVPVMIYDEAGDFSRKRTLTNFNFTIGRILEQYRQFHIILIICLPLFHYLDNAIIDNEIPRILFHISHREGWQSHYKLYSLHKLFFLKMSMSKLPQKSYAYQTNDSNLRGHFGKLPESDVKLLQQFSLVGKQNAIDKAQIKLDGLVTRKDLAEKFGKSGTWASMLIERYNLKPIKVVGCNKFYEASLIARAQSYLENRKRNRF